MCRYYREAHMNEHDDDLESTVHEGVNAETDDFPDTADDDVDDRIIDVGDNEDELDELDDDLADL